MHIALQETRGTVATVHHGTCGQGAIYSYSLAQADWLHIQSSSRLATHRAKVAGKDIMHAAMGQEPVACSGMDS